ncbi:leucine-rich repeat domain-containing protein [Flavobacteriaceae bacterium AU392]|nr:leucine-rich repeat domain-containing protein [Flavobacteriaceae bacterium]RKM83571.1 leucine-rich repeat domain-containing protein [Flavobacteriaceae bacterium AU392]
MLFHLQTNAQVPVNWTNKKNVTTRNGYISKFDGGILWDSGATSKQILNEKIDGWMETIIQKAKQQKIIGFSKPQKIEFWEKIDYAIYMKKGIISISESGMIVFKTDIKCKKGDLIRIEKKEGVISYLLNGKVLYVSKKTVSTDLRVHTAFYISGTGFYKTKVSNSFKSLKNRSRTPAQLKPGDVLMTFGNGAYGKTIFLNGMNKDTYDAIEKIDNKESYYVYFNTEKMTQVDFGTSCQYLTWINKLVIDRSDKVKNYNALRFLTHLEEIYFIDGNPQLPILDLKIISQSKNLKKLVAYNFTKFNNYEMLKNFNFLEELELVNSYIKDLSFLNGMNNLKRLDISGHLNTYQGLISIGNLANLQKLDISGNEKITDLSPLYNCTNLKELVVTKSDRSFSNTELEKIKKEFPELMISERVNH